MKKIFLPKLKSFMLMAFLFANGLFIDAAQAQSKKSFKILTNPLTTSTKTLDLAALIGVFIRGLLTVAGSLAAFFVVWGGVKMILSAGNQDQYKNGRETLFYAVIGLVIAFTGYVVVNFFLGRIEGFAGFGA